MSPARMFTDLAKSRHKSGTNFHHGFLISNNLKSHSTSICRRHQTEICHVIREFLRAKTSEVKPDSKAASFGLHEKMLDSFMTDVRRFLPSRLHGFYPFVKDFNDETRERQKQAEE